MKPSHIFLDFDETMFNHRAYLPWVDEYLTQRFGVAAGIFASQIDAFHERVGQNLRLYHHAEHMHAATGLRWDFVAGEIERELIRGGHDFCYPDTHDALVMLQQTVADVRILTFGDSEYQRYKLNICPVLHDFRLPVHIVKEPKAAFLSREFGEVAEGVLVDDKFPLNLPGNWAHIWITRAKMLSAPKKLKGSTWQIASLNQLAGLIK